MLKFIPWDLCDELELHEALMSPLPILSDVEFFRLNKPLTENSLLQAFRSTSPCAHNLLKMNTEVRINDK